MGQKVNPIGLRLGIINDWSSRWYAKKKNYMLNLASDMAVRKEFEKKFPDISSVRIQRPTNMNAIVNILTARPGVIIGKNGGEVDNLRKLASDIMGVPVHINIEEIRKPELDAKIVAKTVAQQLERRVMFRRAMKRAVTSALKAGAEGIKINISGRLGGAEIARSEWYREGRVPLHTLRADIDYAIAEAKTTYGIIGVKVWIFKGEVFDKQQAQQKAQQVEEVKG
jgi:small subunit ribosomal protein S3